MKTKIKLYQGDCLEVMKKIPDGSVDLILTDPPYGTTACKWDNVIDFELMWEQLNRIIKPNGAIVLFGSEPFSSALRMSNIKNYKYDWIWEKTKPTGFANAKKQPLRNIENITVFYKKTINYNPQGLISIEPKIVNKTNCKIMGKNGFKDGYLQTQTNYPKQNLIFKSETKTLHPTQKPVALLEYLIKTYTQEKETVLDFTMGSGSTGVACKNLNRNFIGIELDEEYFKIAQARIKNHPIKGGH